MAETERENIREATLEGLNAAARKGHHGVRPAVITNDMLHTVLRRRENGESIEDIRPDLIIPAGKRKGKNPSPASIYRALAEDAKRQAHPEAIEQAHRLRHARGNYLIGTAGRTDHRPSAISACESPALRLPQVATSDLDAWHDVVGGPGLLTEECGRVDVRTAPDPVPGTGCHGKQVLNVQFSPETLRQIVDFLDLDLRERTEADIVATQVTGER